MVMNHPLLLTLLCGIVIGLTIAVLSYRQELRLWRLFALMTLVGCLIGLVRAILEESRYAAAQSAYGGRRFTRHEAESIRGERMDMLPDSEFLDGK